MAVNTPIEVQALELAVAKNASRQEEIPGAIWKELAAGDLVTRLEPEAGRPWFELTDAGCDALRDAGGPCYETDACFNCGNSYAILIGTEWFATTCPVCGFYAGDE